MHPDLITTSVWDNPANIDTLKSMWAEGESASEIVRAIGQGVTRNAVIGKVHRLKLAKRDNAIRARPSVQRGNPGQPKINGIAARAEKRHRSAALAINQHARAATFREGSLPPEDDAGVDCTHLVGIMGLTAHTCRWPIGDPLDPGFGYCGKAPIEGKPYCEEHDRRAHVRT